METNLELWNKLKDVPKEAQKTITGGRLKGMTDIKPQWRYKVMTEQFGPCGIGWYYEITDKQIIEGANGEKSGFVDVKLYIKHNGEWSKPIEGTGGSSYIASEKNGLYTSDEVFKMALTDALSVAMAKIGVGASIYMGENDGAKYTQTKQEPDKPWLNENTTQWTEAIKYLQEGGVISKIEAKYKLSKASKDKLMDAALS